MQITIENRDNTNTLLKGEDIYGIEFQWEDKNGKCHKIKISEGVYIERDGLKISSGSSYLIVKPEASNLISVSSN